MTLPTAPLADMQVTRVGFGAWAIGGNGWAGGWGAQDDDGSVATIRAAFERGVNWIDTAAIYGLGRSERVVGRALRDLDETPYVFTKCGLTWDENGDGPHNVMAPDSVRRECDASLQRLGVERIDLYQVHWPPTDGTPIEEYWAVMAELKDSGKVRAIGLSNHDVKQCMRAEEIAHVASLQPPFSLIARDVAADLLPWCAENGTAVIVYSPMQSGLLTGAFSKERVDALPEDDWRKSNDDFTEPALSRNLALVDALRTVAERHGVPVASVAVAWTLAWPQVTAAIVGARRPEQIDGWLPAADLTLTDEDLDDIERAVRETRAGSGPARP